MVLRLKSNKNNDTVLFKDMDIRDIGVIVEDGNNSGYKGIVMRICNDRIVNLSDGDVWNNILCININVRLLPPGTEFVID